jgi:hypothetical protein
MPANHDGEWSDFVQVAMQKLDRTELFETHPSREKGYSKSAIRPRPRHQPSRTASLMEDAQPNLNTLERMKQAS